MGVTPAPTGASRVPPPALNGRKTDRLRLSQLTPEAAVLIVEGVNQPPPTHVIGDRGIRPPDEARAELATGLAAMVAFGRTALKLPRSSPSRPRTLSVRAARSEPSGFASRGWWLGRDPTRAPALRVSGGRGYRAVENLVSLRVPLRLVRRHP